MSYERGCGQGVRGGVKKKGAGLGGSPLRILSHRRVIVVQKDSVLLFLKRDVA